MARVVVYVGHEWDRCEWCFERMGVPARHEAGGWLFVCPVCAEPWLCVPYGPGLSAMAGRLGEPWWFRGAPEGEAGSWVGSSGWGGSSMSEGSVLGGLIQLGMVRAWVHVGNRHRGRGVRLEGRATRLLSRRLVRAITMINPQDGGVVGEFGAGDRDRTWDNSDEAIQLQNALRDDGRRHGERRWLNLEDLIVGYRRLGAFSFDDLWLAAGLAHRHGTRRFECFWQRDQGGGWDVWVLLRQEHVLNREGH